MGATVTPLVITHPIPPLGKAPVSINDLLFNGQVKATHFADVVCGPPSQAAVPGSVLLAAAFQIDYSQGNYQMPFQLPKGACLFARYATLIETFTTDGTTAGTAPTVAIGTSAGGAEIATVALPATANAITSALLATVNPAAGASIFLNVSANAGNVTGIIEVALLYFVPAVKWS